MYSTCTECFSKEALEGFGYLNKTGKAIRIVKYSEDLVLLADEEAIKNITSSVYDCTVEDVELMT